MFEFGENLCPHCFSSGFREGKCSCCGYEQANNKNYANCLQPFTILEGRYLLGHCLGAGGFGITYVAYNLGTNTRCAIKEYFPCHIAFRNGNDDTIYCDKEKQLEYSHGLQRFYDEAKTLATLKGEENIVDIIEYIKANNTAYIVMEFIDGVNIRKYMANRRKVFSYDEAKRIIKDIAVALEKVHIKKLLHRDLTPENILIRKDGVIKIVDFGSARDYVRSATGMSVLVKRGYAPFEQYSSEKRQGPYTDIYSLCCTAYYMISGRNVPDAPDRINGESVARLDTVVQGVPKNFAAIIEKGMSVMPQDRYQSVGEMLAELQMLETTPVNSEVKIHKGPIKSSKKKGFWYSLKVFLGIEDEEREVTNDIPDYFNKTPENISGFDANKSRKFSGFKPIYFVIEEGPAAGFIYEIESDGIYTFGRSGSQCDAVIEGNNPEISRLHCIITSQNHGTTISVEDKSANGTYVDRYGKLEQRRQYNIIPGDVLYLAEKKYAMKVVR